MTRLTRKLTYFLMLALVAVHAGAQDAGDDEDDFRPRGGAPPAERTSGASRGDAAAAGSATVMILAPAETIGLTTREQPVIYWSLSADTDAPIEIAVNDPNHLENPLAETTLKGPTQAGLHKLDLSKLEGDGQPLKLEPGVKYELVIEIAIHKTGASEDPHAACRIMRLAPADAPAPAAETDKAKLAAAYAKEGVWFDYIDALNDAIKAKPEDEALSQKRAKALAGQRLLLNSDGTITEQPRQNGTEN